LHFGIREHAMAAAVNGLALSKIRAFGTTFFIFSKLCTAGDPAGSPD
jgi:transketolase